MTSPQAGFEVHANKNWNSLVRWLDSMIKLRRISEWSDPMIGKLQSPASWNVRHQSRLQIA